MKKSVLKDFIKHVLNEVRRSGGRDEWVDPNGTVYDVIGEMYGSGGVCYLNGIQGFGL